MLQNHTDPVTKETKLNQTDNSKWAAPERLVMIKWLLI